MKEKDLKQYWWGLSDDYRGAGGEGETEKQTTNGYSKDMNANREKELALDVSIVFLQIISAALSF